MDILRLVGELCLACVGTVVVGALWGVGRMLAATHRLVEDHIFGAVTNEAQAHQALNIQVAVAGLPVPTVGSARTEGGR